MLRSPSRVRGAAGDCVDVAGRRSIVDIAAVAVARALGLLVLLFRSARLLRRATRPIAVVCALSCLWATSKVVWIARAPGSSAGGGACAMAGDSAARDDRLAVATAVLSLSVTLVEAVCLVLLKRRIRKVCVYL